MNIRNNNHYITFKQSRFMMNKKSQKPICNVQIVIN